MYKILAAAAALGLLALPIEASAQSASEPTTKAAPAGQNDTAAKPGASAKNATKGKTESRTQARSGAQSGAQSGAKSAAKGSKAATRNKAMGKREARLANTKRMAKHGHNVRYAKGLHGKRFVKTHGGRHAFGYSAPGRLKGHHRHHHRVAYGRGCR